MRKDKDLNPVSIIENATAHEGYGLGCNGGGSSCIGGGSGD